MRAESVLATPVSRWRWAASHLTVAFAGSVVLLGIAGLATGLTYGAAGGDLKRVPSLLGAALVYAPPMWLMVGLTISLVGLAPRWVGASWAILAACVVVGFFGAVLQLPSWLQNLSPFERVPQVPAASLTFLPLVVISAGAAAFSLAGLAGLRRRDIGLI
jgi:ABC-2 type transport system permease protein